MRTLFATVFVLFIQHTSANIYACSCQCPYGSNPSFAYTSENSTDACIQACISVLFNPCTSKNTYACLGTDCAYSSSYNDTRTAVVTTPVYACSCQCPYGSYPSFAYTSENSSQACIRACIAVRFNPCIRWNTYACLGSDCVFSNWYIYLRRTLISDNACSCQCPQGSNRTSAFVTEDSSEACARACNSTLEIDAMKDNTTIDSIIDDFDSPFNLTFDRERNETSNTTDGMTFVVNETNPDLVDPRDAAVLASYRRAVARGMYIDPARFEKVQIRVHQHLLTTIGCKISDVERILQWNWIPRNKCGFRLVGEPLEVPEPSNGKVYSAVEGISFYDNGSFSLNLVEADEEDALFNSDDVELVMKHGITAAGFSLDPLLKSHLPHPFQKATWAPYETLNGTDFLATMLHADLWLKSMSFLVEASAKSPFRIRSIGDSVYSALSKDLYQRLFKESRLEKHKLLSGTRMWLEAGPMKYNIIEQNGSLTYLFGRSNMRVTYEYLLRRVKNDTLGLVDTGIGSNYTWLDHFSTVATEYYDELGESFPELLRLAELSKLTALALVFQYHYRELQRILTLTPPSVEAIAQFLIASNLRKRVFGGIWPLVTDTRVEEILDRTIVKQGINLTSKHLIRNLADSRAQIRHQMIKLENDEVADVVASLQKAFNISGGTISSTAVRSYLANNHSNAEHALLQEIVKGITKRIRSSQSSAMRLSKTMSESRYSVNTSNVTEVSSESTSCYYVPTQIILSYHGNGSYLRQQGGTRLVPRLEYQVEPVTRANPSRLLSAAKRKDRKFDKGNRCQCTVRYAPSELKEVCPDRVFAINSYGNISICQNVAKLSAPKQCRPYYGLCKFTPN